MRHRILFSLGIVGFQPSDVACQSWLPAGLPWNAYNVRDMVVDSDANVLYVAGMIYDSNLSEQAIFRYGQGNWDTLGVFNNALFTVTIWNDTLLAGGAFTLVNGDTADGCAYFDGAEWHPYGTFDSHVRRFRIIDGELYACGYFDMVDGHACKGLAKRNGSQWTNIGQLLDSTATSWAITDVVKHNSTLIACGHIPFSTTCRDIIQYDGVEWSCLGPGIIGGFSGPHVFEQYNDDLYIGGVINVFEGNAGHGLMRWDGTQYNAVGGNVQDLYCGYTYQGIVEAMRVHDGKLFVGGGFGCVGGVPGRGLATWDGTQWCGFGTGIQTIVRSIQFFDDTLYIGMDGGFVDGVDMNCLAKWAAGPMDPDTCSLTVFVPEATAPTTTLYYDPATHTLVPTSTTNANLTLFDPLGRAVLARALQGPISVAALPPGVYVAVVGDAVGCRREMLRFVSE